MAIIQPAFRRLRAMKMVEGKVLQNKTTKELAADFNVSVDTVERTLSWAAKADIFGNYEDKIVSELVPLAHNAIRQALEEGNAKVGLEIFKGLNLLRTGAATPGQRAQDDDLAAYIAAKRDKAQLEENTTIGQLVSEEAPHATGDTPVPATYTLLGPASDDTAVETAPDGPSGDGDPLAGHEEPAEVTH